MDNIIKDLPWLVTQYRQALTRAITQKKGVLPNNTTMLNGLVLLNSDRYLELTGIKEPVQGENCAICQSEKEIVFICPTCGQ